MSELVQKDERLTSFRAVPDHSMKRHPSTIDEIADDHSTLASHLPSLSKIIQIVEPFEFVRGCLGFWLRGSCPEFEIMATPDLEYSVEEGSARRIAAVVIGSDIFQRGAAWIGLEEELARFRLRIPDVPVVAIVAGDMVHEAEDWINRLGLSGYILTSSSTEVASAALRLVIAGGTYFPRTDGHSRSAGQASIDTTLARRLNYVATKLTLRERAVCDCVRQGSPNKIIAHELNMSLSTVKAHVHSIIQKLNVTNRTEVAVAGRTSPLGFPSGR